MTAQPGYGFTGAGGADRRANTLDIAAAFIGYNERRKPQAASRKPQAASRKPQAASRKPQAASRKPQAASRKPQAASRKPQAASRKPQAASRKPQAASRKPQAASRKPQAASRKPQAASRKPQAASRKPQAASRKPQAASRKPQAASRKPQAASRKPRHPARSVAPLPPEPRSGRARARLLSLLPVLALLLGALSPFAADPAAAQVTSPSVPRNVSVTADDEQLILNWQAPSSWGTWSAFGYRVEWKLSTAQATAWARVKIGGTIAEPAHSETQLAFSGPQSDAGGSSHTVTNGTSYDLRIHAFSKGPGQSDVRAGSWVTVTNKVPAARSTDADLTGLTASSSTSASGTFTALTLTPRFLAATTSYMATVANRITYVKLTPTQRDQGDFAHILVGVAGEAPTALVSTDGVASGSASPAIALSVGANVIPVRVVADDLISMMDYTVTITRLEPGTPPPAPTLVPGDGRLTASWSTPGDTYELQYKETSAPDQEDRLTGVDPALGWVNHAQRLGPNSYVMDIRKKSAVIRGPYLRDKPKGLKRGTSYDVRLRVMTSGVAGQWSAVARATTLGTKPEPETTAEPTGPHPVGPSRLGSFGEQTLLTATLTVGGTGRFFGCDNTYAPVPNCSAALTTNSFTHEGTANTLERLYIDTDDANVELSLEYGTAIRQATGHWRRLTLYVDGKSFPLAKGNYLTNLATEWTNTGLTWSAGQRVQVRLTATPWTGVEFESTSFVPSSETGRNDLIVPEGGSATFGVKLSRAPSANVTVNLVKSVLQGASGDANAATVSPATLTFTSTNWSQAQTVTVTGVQDSDGDHEHLMILALVSSTDTDYGSADGTEGVFVTVSDDGGAVQVGAWPAAGREDDNNFLSGHDITFWLSRSSTSPVSVYYTSEEGTATLDADYSMAPSTVTFAPGETRKQVQFYVLDDDVEDSGETFYVVLSNPSGATIAPGYGRAVVEILNDEAHLDGLSVEGAPGAGGPWAKLDLGAFAAETTAYAVTVPHGTTHARLVPATADEDLTLRAGSGTALTRVRSGGSGPAVALAVGANVLVVKTTAGTGVEKTYRVTITRQAETVTTVRAEEPAAEDNQQDVPQPQQKQPPQEEEEEESQTQQGGDPPADQGEGPTDDGGGDNPNGEAQAEEQETQPEEEQTQPEEEEPQEQQAKDASLELRGTNGSDDLQGGDAGDLLFGRQGDDLLVGNGGPDELRGGKGNDELHGGRGPDTLYGGNGDDLLYGNRGADKLLGGNGDDTYTGGPGADRFVFFSGETGDKIITDFGDGSDQIVLRTEAFAWPSVADIIAGAVAQGDRYLVYTLSPGLTVETDVPLRPEDFKVN